MKWSELIFLIGVFLVSNNSAAQCFQIESILVDACGNPEGANEMVRLKIGDQDLNVNDFTAAWPNNNFLGFCANANTANKVAQMNNTITSCGYFKEPISDVLPANSQVLIITSEDFDPTFHDYEGLQDTLIVIFQCSGNTQGHFGNYNSDCGLRTTTISAGPGCSQTVTYDRCLLVNQFGETGGSSDERNGARVNFDENGIPSYTNEACTIPYEPIDLDVNFINGDGVICASQSVDVEAVASGNYSNFSWSSESGVFDNENAFTTNYSPISASEDHYVYFSLENGCGELVVDSLFIDIQDTPTIEITQNSIDGECGEGSVELSVPSEFDIVWNTNETTSTIIPSETGWYSVIGENDCGSAIDSSYVEILTEPSCSSQQQDTSLICEGESTELIFQSSFDLLWSTGDTTSSIIVDETGWYFVEVSNECGSCIDSFYVEVVDVQADFSLSTDQGTAPLYVDILDYQYDSGDTWYINGNEVNYASSFDLEDEGIYDFTLVVTDPSSNCSDELTQTVVVTDTVYEPETIGEIEIPNVFTPNNDGLNDVFGFTAYHQVNVEASLVNRWGNTIQKKSLSGMSGDFLAIWDGKVNNSVATDGVYFYIIEVRFMNSDKVNTYQGFVHLYN